MVFVYDYEKLKIGDKLRKIEDNSIWQIRKITNGTHAEIFCIDPAPKKNPKVQTLSRNSVGFSTVLDFYELEANIVFKEKIYAKTKEEALRIMKNCIEDCLENNSEELLESINITITNE